MHTAPAQPLTTNYPFTEIEVRTTIRLVDDVNECQGQYNYLRQLFTQQNQALKTAEFTIAELKAGQQKADSLSNQVTELDRAMQRSLKKQLRKETRKRKLNAIAAYGVSGVGMAALLYITINTVLK